MTVKGIWDPLRLISISYIQKKQIQLEKGEGENLRKHTKISPFITSVTSKTDKKVGMICLKNEHVWTWNKEIKEWK